MRSRLISLLLALATAALLVSGCGDDGGGDDDATSSADLARFAPAGAIAFGQIAVRPEGGLSDSVNDILDRFPDGDRLGDELIKSLNESLAEDDLTYEENVEPWLGENVGGFITGLRFNSSGEPDVSGDQAAIVIETTDEERAREELVAAAEADGKVSTETYKGIELSDQTSGEDPGTIAVFDGVAVVGGGPAAVRAAIDASTADSLSSNTAIADFLGERQGDSLGVAYADVEAVFDSLQRSGAVSKQQLDSIRKTYGSGADQPFLAGLDVGSDQVSLDFAAGAGEDGGLSPEESSLVQSLPDDAWAVLGLGDIGTYVDKVTDQLGSLGGQEFSTEQLDRVLRRQAGFSLDDLSVLGDAAFFASGESILELQVGGVFEAAPGAARDRLLNALRRGVRSSGQAQVRPLGVEGAEGFSATPSDFPAPINFATRGDKLVIAVGDTATETLLDGGGSSEAVDTARGALGGDDFAVTMALQMAPVIDLVQNSGGGDDSDFAEVRGYLEQFSTIAAGSRTEGDQTLFRIVAELTD